MQSRTTKVFALVAAAFAVVLAASWPVLFSFDLWVFWDRGNLLNLDYLIDKGLMPGVDTYYQYGLLPLLIQRVLFAVFGKGYGPMLACTLVYALMSAGFWAVLLSVLPRSVPRTILVLAMSPILLWVNPNFPYCLVILSLLFALYFVLERRFDIALAVSAVGCVSVPSLPLVLFGLLGLLICVDWWMSEERSVKQLARKLLPGCATYLALCLVLAAVFGWRSMLATALPFSGLEFYRTFFKNVDVYHDFLMPAGASYRYLLVSRAGWWIVCTALLFVAGIFEAVKVLRTRKLEPLGCAIVLCAIIHAVFAFYAYGTATQHVIFDPLLALGVVLAVAAPPLRARETPLLVGLSAIAIVSSVGQARETWVEWRTMRASEVTHSLYANPAWVEEWSKIVELSKQKNLLLLAFATGVHHYFPTVRTADIWTLNVNQMLLADRQRLIEKIGHSDVVVEAMLGPTLAIDGDPEIQTALGGLCLTEISEQFQIWQRISADAEHPECLANPRDLSKPSGAGVPGR